MTVSRRQMPIRDLESHDCAFVTVPELAAYLGVGRRLVMKFIEAGILPAYRFGRRYKIQTSEAIVFIVKQRLRPEGA